jgi:hypothetical protein
MIEDRIAALAAALLTCAFFTLFCEELCADRDPAAFL